MNHASSASAAGAPRLHATLVWLALLGATGLAWWLAEGHSTTAHLASALVIAIAGFKSRLIVLHFMELRSAPLAWRLLIEGWVVGVVAMIAIGYWLAVR